MDKEIDRPEFMKELAKLSLLTAASIQVTGCEDEKYDAILTVDEEGELTINDIVATNEQIQVTSSGSTTSNSSSGSTNGSSGSGSSGGGGTQSCPPSSCSQVANFHTHTCSVSGSTSIKLNCFGGHTHTVTLSSSDLQNLCQSASVTKTSSIDQGHSHAVTISV
ncbi:MAG: hypothetical protein GKR87_02140 [Kiritimatiellae bacterium]|nr:hypothetical protein [Kiritimatiellia bacterium]